MDLEQFRRTYMMSEGIGNTPLRGFQRISNLIGKRLKTSALKRLIREPIINLKQTKDKGKREEYIKLVEELFEL